MPPGTTDAGCPASTEPVIGSIDGDGVTDLVVGMPHDAAGAGAVEIRLSSGGTQLVTTAGLGLSGGASDRLGSAVAVRDLDDDGCSDLVVGAPGFNAGRGAVIVLRGSAAGVVVDDAEIIEGEAPMAQFGSSVAITDGSYRDVWVGAPRQQVTDLPDAGVIHQFTVQDGQLRRALGLIQGDNGLPGSFEAGDRFGEVLTGDGAWLVAGTPGEDLGTLADAGVVTALRNTEDGLVARAYSQDSDGVPGTAEAGDRFGAAVHMIDTTLVVGVPGEDIGSTANTGAIQVMRQFYGTDAFTPGAGYHQDSTGVPGVNEPSDGWGSAVAVGRGLACEGVPAIAVGAAGENVGEVVDAGSVTVLPRDASAAISCPGRTLTQGSGGLGGTTETSDRVGERLSVARDAGPRGATTADRLVVAAPTEDIGSVSNAGLVLVGRASGVAFTSYTRDPISLAEVRYGAALGHPGGA